MTRDAPYLVTALITAVAWAATHLINTVSDAPLVEYCWGENKGNVRKVSIKNLSDKVVFRGIKFAFLSDKDTPEELFNQNIEADPPHFSGFTTGGISIRGRQIEFFIPALYPGGKITMKVEYKSNENIGFRFAGTGQQEYAGTGQQEGEEKPKNKPNSKLANENSHRQPIFLVECGIPTLMVAYKFHIISVFIIGGIILVFCMLWFSRRRRGQGEI